MGHGHHNFPEIPDFRKYNVEDVPLLMETKRRLAVHGLHDPWLRNEVWRYQIPGDKQTRYNFHRVAGVFTGFKPGLVLAVIATVIGKTFARKVEHH